MPVSHRKFYSRLAVALIGALAGAAVFLLVYGTATLHPTWDGWILNGYDEWDVQQHYAGWVLFRNSHWAFPLGLADTIAAPDGTVITYTDSLPWVSIFFKLLRGVLPSTFQFFGRYTLGCFALQGAAGALLCTRGMRGKTGLAFAGLGGLLFACLPTLWERAFRHVALASHFLYLFALYGYLEYRQALRRGRKPLPWIFPLLAFAAVGIHPYFLPLVMICALCAAIDRGRIAHGWAAAAGQFGVSLAAALAGGLLCGAIGFSDGASRAGYGDFSMNLNAIFNPSSRGGYTWSRLLPVLPQQGGQYDGFNYLGLGALLLIGFGMIWAVVTAVARRGEVAGWWRRNGPLLGCCVFLTLFAASNRIYWGNAGVELPLPSWLAELCGIFRSSGRMFYLVGACMVLFGVYTLRSALAGRSGVLLCAALALAVAVQGWDLSAVAAEKRALFDAEINATVVNNEQTANLGTGHARLLAAGDIREDRLRLLAILAGKQGLSTNLDISVSGSHPAAAASVEQAAALLESGSYDPTAVYVTTDGAQWENWQQIFGEDAGVTFFVADSCYFMVPAAG